MFKYLQKEKVSGRLGKEGIGGSIDIPMAINKQSLRCASGTPNKGVAFNKARKGIHRIMVSRKLLKEQS